LSVFLIKSYIFAAICNNFLKSNANCTFAYTLHSYKY